jgi:hypothetical protein
MSNLQIYREIKDIYDPKTAFGNKEILGLFKRIVKPNEKGEFETSGDIMEIIEWRCVNCGRLHQDEREVFDRYENVIGRECSCGAKSVISF